MAFVRLQHGETDFLHAGMLILAPHLDLLVLPATAAEIQAFENMLAALMRVPLEVEKLFVEDAIIPALLGPIAALRALGQSGVLALAAAAHLPNCAHPSNAIAAAVTAFGKVKLNESVNDVPLQQVAPPLLPDHVSSALYFSFPRLLLPDAVVALFNQPLFDKDLHTSSAIAPLVLVTFRACDPDLMYDHLLVASVVDQLVGYYDYFIPETVHPLDSTRSRWAAAFSQVSLGLLLPALAAAHVEETRVTECLASLSLARLPGAVVPVAENWALFIVVTANAATLLERPAGCFGQEVVLFAQGSGQRLLAAAHDFAASHQACQAVTVSRVPLELLPYKVTFVVALSSDKVSATFNIPDHFLLRDSFATRAVPCSPVSLGDAHFEVVAHTLDE